MKGSKYKIVIGFSRDELEKNVSEILQNPESWSLVGAPFVTQFTDAHGHVEWQWNQAMVFYKWSHF